MRLLSLLTGNETLLHIAYVVFWIFGISLDASLLFHQDYMDINIKFYCQCAGY